MAADPRVLRDLAGAGEIDELFALVTVADMAHAWMAHHRRRWAPEDEIAEDDPYWWAMELWWTTRWYQDVERVRAGLLALIDAADTEYELRSIGAAPLESFVSDDPDDLAWLEERCAADPRMRIALSAVWCSDVVSAETLDRLERAAGVTIDRRHRPR